MSDTLKYRVHKELRFTVHKEEFSVIIEENKDQKIYFVEKVGKHHSNDFMVCGKLIYKEGKWDWIDDLNYYRVKYYGAREIADGIPEYLNKYPLPEGF